MTVEAFSSNNRQSAVVVLSNYIDRLEAKAGGLRALRDAIITAQALRDPAAPEGSDADLVPIAEGSPAEAALWDLVVSLRA